MSRWEYMAVEFRLDGEYQPRAAKEDWQNSEDRTSP